MLRWHEQFVALARLSLELVFEPTSREMPSNSQLPDQAKLVSEVYEKSLPPPKFVLPGASPHKRGYSQFFALVHGLDLVVFSVH